MNRAIFFKEYKNRLDKNHKLSQKEVDAIDLFLNFYQKEKDRFSTQQWAYVFATAFHETNGTFSPVREAYWLSENWRKNHLRYYPYYGRGYVQITWKSNYRKFSNILGEDFVKNMDLVMKPAYAFEILVKGFEIGAFTGKKISDYINSKKCNYVKARRCINGKDKAETIASYARCFEDILKNI